jgi:hypothetical protein
MGVLTVFIMVYDQLSIFARLPLQWQTGIREAAAD